LRTEPNTRNPFETRTLVVPQPIPVETPVTTTSLLFAIAFLLRWITDRLQHLQWLSASELDWVCVDGDVEVDGKIKARTILKPTTLPRSR
jgi:hypothetical protein